MNIRRFVEIIKNFSERERLKKEFWGMFRYGMVGGSSLLMHAGLYHLFSRVLFVHGDRTIEFVVALVITSVYNFTLHRIWTFQLSHYSHAMLLRYICVVLGSMGTQSFVFYVGHGVLKIYDYYVFAGAAVVAAFVQYLGHRFITFRKDS